MTTISSKDCLSLPSSGKGPGVLVLHAWWGLNDFFRGTCNRLAQAGFVVLAPDLFAGQIAQTIEEAEQHKSAWDEEHEVPQIILPAVDNLREHPAVVGHGLGIIGFSMGAYWALWLAQKRPELIRSVVLFYGTNGGGGDFQKSRAAYLGHFAELDPYESGSGIQELEKTLKKAQRPTNFYTYPGTSHWFFEQDRADAYDAQAAGLAWDRTLAFLLGTLVSA
ncbi:MAG: dienelactone hydrolase family protein [Anaerolineales bacterium]|nr:MAG: dienelactone hydrolase family protein [Anaerolineales bacterium]